MKHFFVAGFDFGTSYSKVVVRDQLTGIAKAVTFGAERSGLFPSFVRVRAGFIAGPDGQDDGLLLSYPKLIATDAVAGSATFSSLYGTRLEQVHRLLETQSLEDVAPLILTRYFLSVLNAIHQFIRHDEDWRLFDASVDPLVVQIAVPIGLNSADQACDKLMQRALASATLLRAGNGGSGPDSAANELKRALQMRNELDLAARENLNARCITYPEVAAGVQTVLRSPNTPDGKYITIDVGAGTVDLNAFHRRRRSENETGPGLNYWACEVRPLGFARLKLPAAAATQARHELSVNPLPESDLLRQLAEALHHLIYGAFRYQPNHVIGGGKNPWSHHTFAYIWGGGAAHPAYEQTFLQTLQSLRIGVNDANRLPRPSDHFVLPSDVDFGRLAVAYGLSFHKANLESVRLPSELKTFDQLYPAYWHEVINTEKICTCRGNPACLRCYGLGLIRPDTSIAPALDAGVMQPVPRPAIQKSRVQIALEKCVCKYHAFEARRPFLIERFLLLDRIRQLRRLPEIDDASLIRQQAEAILLFNVRRFKGRVRVLKHSAKRVNDGCRCVVDGQHRESYADVVVHGPPQQIEKLVNGGDQHRSVDLFCCLNRTERNEFILEFEDLATFR